MKFSDGFWLNRGGFDVKYAADAYEITPIENGLRVTAVCQKIYNRGMTLGGPVIEVTYTSTQKDVIKVHAVHYKGGLKNKPEFDLYEDFGYKPEIIENEDCFKLISGSTTFTISKSDWKTSFSRGGKRLTGSGWRSLSYITEDRSQLALENAAKVNDRFWEYPPDTDGTFMRDQLTLGVAEQIYGFGEKFTSFTKNGQNVEIWNADGGTCSEQSYKSIPFYISSEGYGVFVNTSGKVSYEVASDTVSKVSFTVSGEELEYFFIGGDDTDKPALHSVLENYTALTGKPSLPPAYSFGLWLTTSFVTKYDEETVTSFIDGMAERNIPLSVFHFDCFWMREFEWCNFRFDERQFPDPAAMLSRLKARGLKICVWINPYIAQKSDLFIEAESGGYLLHNLDGSVFQCDMWQPGMGIVDFTNPAACEWYAGKLRVLCELGVDSFKTDFGERIPTAVKYYDGSDPVSMHNYYTYLYNKCVFDVLTEFYGEGKACLFARSATVGGQKFPVHWGGDCSAEYSSMAETLRGGLSLCASGFGFYSHDISGFEATATPDIYKRWSAFGLLSTHSRLHGNSSYRVPWLFDEESVDVLRFFTNLKGKLMPYVWAEAVKTSKTGVPMMRAMVIDFDSDPICRYLDTQYMFGDSLLVSPIMNETGDAQIYLPDCGIWTDIISGEKFSGGRYYNKKYDYFGLPLLAKPNSILPFGNFSGDFEYDYLDGAEFVIYEIEDEISFDIYNTAAEKLFTLTAKREGEKVTVTHTETDKKFTVKLSCSDNISIV
ncbi:MAG: alpha-xylosidase [Ruminococcus sp.]|jgi:alpha-D-xyloside xylohydrolase|nr:alpha-xylosidase [Ruminococcus sp.]